MSNRQYDDRPAQPQPGPGSTLRSPEQLAEYLGVPLATVYRWRARRDGPRGVKVGRHVRYRDVDVESWLEALPER